MFLLFLWVGTENLWNLSNLLDLFDLWVLRRPVLGRHLDVAPNVDIHSYAAGWWEKHKDNDKYKHKCKVNVKEEVM